MTLLRRLCVLWLCLLAVAGTQAHAQDAVLFDAFDYEGHDPAFEQPLPPDHYRNPVLAGFYPDPSVVRAGDMFYLVNSSFGYFPGIPVAESRDLVHWQTIGHVLDRPGEVKLDGLGASRGVFAPAIAYHDGTFYVVNTVVDGGGNFIATAKHAAGPWSNPMWLRDVDGIDPSLFFDDDGKAYLLNNGAPEGEPLYEGHRAIWLQQIDVTAGKMLGARKVILNGGTDIAKKPIWIEGPHLYKRNGWYYLMCAEGGTGPQHSEVVLRSRSVWGPYVAYEGTPILTQRDLPDDRAEPIINAGHADLVEAADGSWWAVFLASRAYDGTHYNTGRETYLLPVTWKNDWPIILPKEQAIPRVAAGPSFMQRNQAQAPISGNFHWHDDFDKPTLDSAWMFMRAPAQSWADLASHPGKLAIHPLPLDLDTRDNPSFLARRQQHLVFEASTSLEVPTETGVEAGIAAFQNERYWYAFGVQRKGKSLLLTLRRHRGDEVAVVATAALPPGVHTLALKITGNGGVYGFAYNAGDGWKWLEQHADGTVLSTDVAGGFIGTTLGPYARRLGHG
ncbi:glycoside hydrolase family 43 protein [Dyella sp. C11]|uniref:glycoside hydrolase family 43 protein n=1 Tax=Dyella sp. C11 TaxID=2126991 RepID=UPI000D659634|nr:glycoside hydrolase family 43 protein [Dyella sp. C11]